MTDSIDQYDVRFPKTQALLRLRLPIMYRLIGQLYLRVLSVDRYKLQRSLKSEVRQIRNSKSSQLVFVQVGSNDGLTNDPIRGFILEDPCTAVLVEPVPNCFARLQANYSEFIDKDLRNFDIRLRQMAVGPTSGTQKFYAVSTKAKDELGDSLPEWWDQIGSFDRGHITRHLDGILDPYIDELEIPTLRLGELLEAENLERIDILHIDAEGHDVEVLKSMDLSETSVSCILIEWKHLSSEDLSQLLSLLDLNGYTVRKFKSDILATLK